MRFRRIIPLLVASSALVACAPPPAGTAPVQLPPPVTSVGGQAAVRITKIATSVVAGAEETVIDGIVTNSSPSWRSYVVTLRPSAGLMSSVTVNGLGPGQTGVWQQEFAGRITASVAAISAAAASARPLLSTATVKLTMSAVTAVCPAGPCPARRVTGTMVNPDSVQHQVLIVNLLASDGSAITGGVYNLPPGQTGMWSATFSSNADPAHLSVTATRIEAFM